MPWCSALIVIEGLSASICLFPCPLPFSDTPDLINFANSSDVYQIYADVIAFDENRQKDDFEHFFAPVASRRDEFEYIHSDEELLAKYKNQICNHGRYAKIFSDAMGDRYFMAKFKTIEEVEEFRQYSEARK